METIYGPPEVPEANESGVSSQQQYLYMHVLDLDVVYALNQRGRCMLRFDLGGWPAGK